MAVTKDQINTTLRRVSGDTSSEFDTAFKDYYLYGYSFASKLEVGADSDGFINLTPSHESFSTDARIDQSTHISENLVQISDRVPGINLRTSISDSADLDAITGGGTSSGSRTRIYGAGSPAAAASAISTVTERPVDEVQELTSSLATPAFKTDVSNLSGILSVGVGNPLLSAISGVNSQINNLLGLNTGSLVLDIILKNDKTVQEQLAALELEKSDEEEVIRLISDNKRDEAIEYVLDLQDSNGFTEAEIEEIILTVNVDPSKIVTPFRTTPRTPLAAGTSSPDGAALTTVPAFNSNTSSPICYTLHDRTNTSGAIGGYTGSTAEEFDTSYFTYIDTQEELIAELRSATREITTIISHYTDTYNNQDIGAEEVHEWHLINGWAGCGYHYIIRRDGRLQRGRPLNRIGAHADDNGFNRYTIGISMVGGINAPSGTPDPWRYRGPESLTPKSMATHKMFYDAFFEVFPGGQAWGHQDITDNRVDPGFSISDYIRNNFGKVNLTSTPKLTGPATPADIAAGRYL